MRVNPPLILTGQISKPIVDQSDLKKDQGNKITVKEHFDVGELTPEQKKQKIKEFTKKLRRLKDTRSIQERNR